MARSLLATASYVLLIGTLGIGEAFAFGVPKIPGGGIEIEPILQLTTRDRNRIAIQSDLLGAWTLNIQNILCIYGDQVETGDQPETKEVRDLDTLGVINTANYFKKEKKLPKVFHQSKIRLEFIVVKAVWEKQPYQ